MKNAPLTLASHAGEADENFEIMKLKVINSNWTEHSFVLYLI